MTESDIEIYEETTLDENKLFCLITGDQKKESPKERNLQEVARMLTEEYGFDISQLQRDYSISYEDELGKKKRMKVDVAVFEQDKPHEESHINRIAIVQDEKTKDTDKSKGVK